MEGTVGAPPQRVCPKCARISWATGPQCPYCNARFRRQQGITPWMLVAAAVAIIAVVAIMLLIAGNQLDKKLNDRVDEVNKELDANFDQIQKEVQEQINQQGGGAIPPVATPTPPAIPTTTPSPEGEATTTATPSPSATESASPSETATPTPTIMP
jgi:hypothetical protein